MRSGRWRSIFDEVSLPHLTVTEPNPAARLDFWRFASEQVAADHRMQFEIIRRHWPGRWITHNFMGFFTVSIICRSASTSISLLGLLSDRLRRDFPFDDRERLCWEDIHPDVAPFHHDLYRGVGRGRCWVMEQQPGPVNWARWNPRPRPAGAAVDTRSARPWRRSRLLFPLASGALRAGADARRAQPAGLARAFARRTGGDGSRRGIGGARRFAGDRAGPGRDRLRLRGAW